ncbi:hypothetical protein [Bradyrhizobium sp.]|jgi:3-oxoacyl-[acyl-carrier-protein] synthase-3|uniref:hypothetical protein n=1 Tax=Bradyrhizobium sp. TaxID=376 RepID=UPI002E083BD8|nr:hypothetical protein [Bradyrhizobium sp.]
MTPAKIYLHGCRYVIGEDERPVADIANFSDFLVQNQMIDDADLWGWDRYRLTRRSAIELGAEAAQRTLAAFGSRRHEVDAAILCGTRFPSDVDGHADVVGRFLQSLDLRETIPYGVSLNRCATLMAGLSLAESLVVSGKHRAILLTACDTSDNEPRLRPFATFSDGAASCVITRDISGEFELITTAAAVDAAAMRPNGEISAALARRVNADLESRSGVPIDRIKRLTHNNLFKPIVMIKEQQAGFRKDQLFMDNIGRIGHVFASDPLINLIDLLGSGALDKNDLVAMGSSVSGARFGALLRVV